MTRDIIRCGVRSAPARYYTGSYRNPRTSMRDERPESSASRSSAASQYPEYRSHYRPRTRKGWIAVVSFLLLFALTQPPAVYLIGNRIEPRILGMPFLYVYLLVIYVALIGVLIWAQRRRI